MHLAAFFFLLVFLQSGIAMAQPASEKCACTPNTFDIRWRDADAVFAGTVQKINVVKKYMQYGTDDLPVEVVLQIDDAYKGVKSGEKFTLHTNLTRETCTGHPFELGQRYLLFAYRRKEEAFELWSLYNFPSGTYDVGGLCGGTKTANEPDTAKDMKEIKKKLVPPEKKENLMNRLFND